MHGHGNLITKVEDPGGVRFPSWLRGVAVVVMILGAILFIFGGMSNSLRAWQALLLSYQFFLMLTLGGMVFTCVQYCANARWSIAVRRLAEGMAVFMPVCLVLFLILVTAGWGTLYDLNSPIRQELGKAGLHFSDGGNDLIKKSFFLSQGAVIAKGILFYIIWGLFTFKIRKNSLDADKTKNPAHKDTNIKLSIGFLLLFAYTFTIHCIDLLMALEPKWFSTMFGVYCFSGLFLSSMCVIAMIAVAMRRNRVVGDAIQRRHLYDLGTWIMAFSCFMMYIGFSQFMLIWYANLPEETFYMIARTENGWQFVMMLLPLLKWIIPFAVLMPQGFRSNPVILVGVGLCVLVGQWVDLYWMIYPVFSASPLVPGAAEIGAFLALLGAFGLALDWVYGKYSVLPMGDPHLVMSVNGSYI